MVENIAIWFKDVQSQCILLHKLRYSTRNRWHLDSRLSNIIGLWVTPTQGERRNSLVKIGVPLDDTVPELVLPTYISDNMQSSSMWSCLQEVRGALKRPRRRRLGASTFYHMTLPSISWLLPTSDFWLIRQSQKKSPPILMTKWRLHKKRVQYEYECLNEWMNRINQSGATLRVDMWRYRWHFGFLDMTSHWFPKMTSFILASRHVLWHYVDEVQSLHWNGCSWTNVHLNINGCSAMFGEASFMLKCRLWK